MFRHFYLLLLFCLVIHSGNADKQVSGKKGGNITLTCEFKNDKNFVIELFSQSEDIDVCQEKSCSGRVFKQRDCDVVIEDLSFSDAGKYTLRVYYRNDETNVVHQKEWNYQLHIYDEISVKTGKPLKLHVLMSNADKVEKNSSGEWKEVWKRGHGVSSDRMDVSDGNLIIKAFTDIDVGSYRVLSSEGEILITVTVRESGTGSAGKWDTKEHRNTDTPVSGKKGGNITLTCEFEANKIVLTELFSQSEYIDVCQEKSCSGRVFKQRDCDVVIKNLTFSDAGKYTLRVYYRNDEANVVHEKEQKYQLHIHDEISMKTGQPLKLHVLMSNADKVEKNSSEGWKEVWKRGHGVSSDRMDVSDGNLIIKAFTDNDVGSYRVLGSDGEILITVTVRESGTGSAGKWDTKEHKTWIWPVVVSLGILAVAVISVVIWRYRRTGYRRAAVEDNPNPPDVPLTILTERDETAQES